MCSRVCTGSRRAGVSPLASIPSNIQGSMDGDMLMSPGSAIRPQSSIQGGDSELPALDGSMAAGVSLAKSQMCAGPVLVVLECVSRHRLALLRVMSLLAHHHSSLPCSSIIVTQLLSDESSVEHACVSCFAAALNAVCPERCAFATGRVACLQWATRYGAPKHNT